MPSYALVGPDDQIIETRIYPDNGLPEIPETLAPNKPRLMPTENILPAYDPVTEVVEDQGWQVAGDKVTRAYLVRPKTEQEAEPLRRLKMDAISAAFAARTFAPIAFNDKQWDADTEARSRISAAIQLMTSGVMASPRPWTAYGEVLPTTVTLADLTQLAGAMAAREDELFVVKKTMEAQLAALNGAQAIDEFNAEDGWPE